MDKQFSLTEAALYLGVSQRKIWLLIKKGHLNATRDPLDERRKLVKETDLARLRNASIKGRQLV